MLELFNVQMKFLYGMRPYKTHPYLVELLLYGSIVFLVVSAQLPLMYETIYHLDDVTTVTDIISLQCTDLLTSFKIAAFFYQKSKFINIVQQLTVMYSSVKAPAAQHFLMTANQLALNAYKLYFCLAGVTGSYFIVNPLIKYMYALVRGKSIVRELPMPMRFPYDTETSPGYEISCIYIGIVAVLVVVFASAIDGLFVAFNMHLRAHFQGLQHFIADHKFSEDPQLQRIKIKAIITYHTRLLDLSHLLRKAYQPIVFAEFFLTSLELCVIVYQLIVHLDSYMYLIVNCFFLSSITFQLFVYSYGGEKIKEESLMVGKAVQLTNWYVLTPEHCDMLRLLILRSQRVVVIKAGFYEATLECFLTILKAAMSYITLIQSIAN